MRKVCLPPEGRVLAAFSGGADSTALLHRLHSLDKTRVAAAHYNHNLRLGAVIDEDFTGAFCERYGIMYFSGSGDVEKASKLLKQGVEETAREMRYAFLEETALREGFDYIATAHNADDNAETMLFNLIRGTGMTGLCGIPARRGNIIRPMLKVTRDSIMEYLESFGLPYCSDPTNADTAYSRNRLRLNVVPELKLINPSLAGAFGRTAEALRLDEDFFEGHIRELMKSSFETEEGIAFPLHTLKNLHPSLGKRICRALCARVGIVPESVHISDMLALLDKNPPACINLPKGVVARRRRGILLITK